MRQVSALTLQPQGVEPIIIIGIKWVDGGNEVLYGDKALPGVLGAIVSMGNLSQTVDVLGNASVGEISITLSDIDGSLKNYMDTVDIHKRPVTVYHAFANSSEKFPIFPAAQINSPIVWDEGTRTLSFNILTQIEAKDVGPICFGECVYVPVEASNKDAGFEGKVITPFGLIDPLLNYKKELLVNRLALLFAQNASLAAYDAASTNIAPEPLDVLNNYIDLIGIQDKTNRAIIGLIRQIERIEEQIQLSGGNPALIAVLTQTKASIERRISSLSNGVATVVTEKEQVGNVISLIQYELQLHTEIMEKINAIVDEVYKVNRQIVEINRAIAEQEATVRTSILVENGETFPQNQELELLINQLKFRGSFSGRTFTFTDPGVGLPQYSNLSVTGTGSNTFTLSDPTAHIAGLKCWIKDDNGYHVIEITEQNGSECTFELQVVETEDPPLPDDPPQSRNEEISGHSASLLTQVGADPIDEEERRNIVDLEGLVDAAQAPEFISPTVLTDGTLNTFTDGLSIHTLLEVSPVIHAHWINSLSAPERHKLQENQFFVSGGSVVTRPGVSKALYIVNVVETEIHGVFGYRTVDGIRALYQFPESFYTIAPNTVVDGVTVCSIIFQQKPSLYYDQNWEDTIYVTVTSTVGPNPVDIMIWIIENCTDLTYDTTSFNTMRDILENYPMHFALLEPKNVIDLIKDIAYQSRSAAFLVGNKWYLKYLSATPTPVDTFTDADFLVENFNVSITDTESLTTKLNIKWRRNYLPENEEELILRHNVPKYGVQEEEVDFYCLTDFDLVHKTGTFWLIRKSNSWKRIELTSPLTKLLLEPLDAVTLDFTGIIENLSCIGIIESADYDSNTHTIKFIIWIPIRAGESSPYKFAYPSSCTDAFPDDESMAGSTFNPVGVANTLLGFGETRPNDWGKANLADISDEMPGSPLNSSGASVSVQRPENKTFPIPDYPDALKKNLFPTPALNRGPLPRETYVGVLTSVDNVNNIYDVVLEQGLTVKASLYSKTADQFLRTGMSVVIIRADNPQSNWWISGKLFDHETRQVTIQQINSESLLCVSEEGVQGTVALPYNFRRSFYDGITDSRGYTQRYVNDATRFLIRNQNDDSENTLIQYLDPAYKVGDTIVILKLPYGVLTAQGVTPWIDANVDGRGWTTQETVSGTVRISRRLIQSNPFGINFEAYGQSRRASAYWPEAPTDTLVEAYDYVKLAYYQPDDRYYVVSYSGHAKHVMLRIGAGEFLYRDDKDTTQTVVRYWDGSSPGDTLLAYNHYNLEANENDILVCERQDNGQYVITGVQYDKPRNIVFRIGSGSWTKGGVSNATVMRYDRNNPATTSGPGNGAWVERVYDDSNTFEDASAPLQGIAEFYPDRNHYVIKQMWCEAGE